MTDIPSSQLIISISTLIPPLADIRVSRPAGPLISSHGPAVQIVILNKRRSHLHAPDPRPLDRLLSRRRPGRREWECAGLDPATHGYGRRHARVEQADHVVARRRVGKGRLVGDVSEEVQGVRRVEGREAAHLQLDKVRGREAGASKVGSAVGEAAVGVAHRVVLGGRDKGAVRAGTAQGDVVGRADELRRGPAEGRVAIAGEVEEGELKTHALYILGSISLLDETSLGWQARLKSTNRKVIDGDAVGAELHVVVVCCLDQHRVHALREAGQERPICSLEDAVLWRDQTAGRLERDRDDGECRIEDPRGVVRKQLCKRVGLIVRGTHASCRCRLALLEQHREENDEKDDRSLEERESNGHAARPPFPA